MYNTTAPRQTTINRNTGYKGERIEEKINRIVNNKEPIKDGAPIIYTDRSEGVKPEYNIRTDRFEIAVDAMDMVSKAHIAKREENIANFQKKLDAKNENLNKGENSGDPKP